MYTVERRSDTDQTESEKVKKGNIKMIDKNVMNNIGNNLLPVSYFVQVHKIF